MTYFYSPSTSGLYDDTFHFKNEIPSDAIELTDEEYLNYWEGLNSNKALVLNTNGKLELIDKALSNEELIKPFSANLQKHLDDTAISYGYDNIYTAISYADEPAVLRFQDEGKAFRKWRSLFWKQANVVKQEITDGLREVPSIDSLIQELPKLTITYTEG